jgi:hypothetical protein
MECGLPKRFAQRSVAKASTPDLGYRVAPPWSRYVQSMSYVSAICYNCEAGLNKEMAMGATGELRILCIAIPFNVEVVAISDDTRKSRFPSMIHSESVRIDILKPILGYRAWYAGANSGHDPVVFIGTEQTGQSEWFRRGGELRSAVLVFRWL